MTSFAPEDNRSIVQIGSEVDADEDPAFNSSLQYLIRIKPIAQASPGVSYSLDEKSTR